MGVDVAVLDFLLKFRGKIRGETLQLGRQGFHIGLEANSEMRTLAEQVLRRYDSTTRLDQLAEPSGFTNRLFSYLGSERTLSMDASAYEGADLVFDLNLAVPDNFESRFDAIFDGGTIEHIFNLPVVFSNVKRMLKPGGLFLSVNAANNQLGHGFYQFSPELMHRVFSENAGFRIELLQLVDADGLPNPIDAPDPAVLGHRHDIGCTSGPTYILVAATKGHGVSDKQAPMQSDYLDRWRSEQSVPTVE